MSGLVAAGRNRMDVDVERPWSRRVESEALDPGFLACLPQRDRFAGPLAGLGVAPGLEPAPEFPVMEQQHLVAGRRHDDGAPREVPVGDPPVERLGMAGDEGQDLPEVGGFLRVGGPVSEERVADRRAGRGGAWAALPGNHDHPHGRAAGPPVSTSAARCGTLRPMGLGRTTRFAPLPAGARRVSVMRAGTAGIKALAPSPELLAAFQARKRALVKGGAKADQAHAEAHRGMGYRERYLEEVRARPEALVALRALLAEARESDVYLMCMCPYRTPGRACHTYALLDLARQLDPAVRQLPEPQPRVRPRA